MIIDGRSVPDGEVIEADLCIIGGGPAGITVASALGSSDLRICLLESGGELPTKTGIDLADGESTGEPYFPLATARARALGGSSHIWGEYLRARPLDPIDFEERDEIPWSGWPYSHEELKENYREAQELLNLGPYEYDAEPWESEPRVLLPVSDQRVETTVFHYSNSADFLRQRRVLEKTANVLVMLHSTATEIVMEKNKARKVEVVCLGGPKFAVSARAVIVAAGGIDNPRLLLCSTRSSPHGIGNENDLVGRFFMEHPYVQSAVFVPADIALAQRMGFYQLHTVDGVTIRGALRLHEKVLRSEGLLNAAFFFLPMDELLTDDVFRSLYIVARAVQGRPYSNTPLARHLLNIGSSPLHTTRVASRVAMRKRGQPVFRLAVAGEQAPNPKSRVTLSGDVDSIGMRRPQLHWALTDLETRSIRRGQEIIDSALRDAGLGHLENLLGDERPRRSFQGQWHHMGTTRMHSDPQKGVVDSDLRVHGTENLYVAGSSTFPTAGYANATLTIVALSLRLADHLRERIDGGIGPWW